MTTRNSNSRFAVTAASRKGASRSHGRGGTLLGVFIGLVVGLGLAAGVAYFVAKPDVSAADKPRFDFYKILPGGEEPKVQVERKIAPDRALVDQARDKEAERSSAKVAVAEPASKAAGAGDHFWLQAGSFAAEPDAENLKAQLALAGWEARVQQGTLPDKGVRYRVRLGPYDNTDELNRIKNELAKKGFDVAVIKF
jgi:cell division protein FtsN